MEFNKQQWAFLCVLLSAEVHVPFLTLLCSLILSGRICPAEHDAVENRLKRGGYTQCSDTKAEDTFKTLIR